MFFSIFFHFQQVEILIGIEFQHKLCYKKFTQHKNTLHDINYIRCDEDQREHAPGLN